MASFLPLPGGQIGRRTHSRLRVRLPARLVTLAATFAVTLEDLSVTGARIAVSQMLRPGDNAVLQWEGNEAFCTIAWFDGERCGLAFDEALPDRVVIATREIAPAAPPSEINRAAARAFVRGANRPGFGDT